ncbi:fibronectin type III domain-containing protein, partial [Saccharothrix sp. MB29]|nr:fibronectin type III domain-containing protein [Saccharothrix sp. MB29]
MRAESARITRGEDGRVYVDDPTGEHLFVVDGGGRVTPVDVAAESAPTAPTEPIPPPDTPQQPPPPPPAPPVQQADP